MNVLIITLVLLTGSLLIGGLIWAVTEILE